MKKPRLLFVLRHRDNYYSDEPYSYSGGLSSGLLNSARFVVDMLNANGVTAELVQVPDNNAIDREIVRFRPTHVIVEAFWVVPEKFEVLKRLHPRVKFIVRNHSELPFLAEEGNAISWTIGYLQRGVSVAPNSVAMAEDTRTIARANGTSEDLVMYLPNSYKLGAPQIRRRERHAHFHVGCFGAIRPLKNQLTQAVAALNFAERIGVKLHLHINATRVERGNNILTNIRALFATQSTHGHKLIEHSWLPHDRFLHLISMMDMALCVSFTETFCIVAADAVNMGIPTVASPEVRWISTNSMALPTESDSIVSAMLVAHKDVKTGRLQRWNRLLLQQAIEQARDRWLATFKQ